MTYSTLFQATFLQQFCKLYCQFHFLHQIRIISVNRSNIHMCQDSNVNLNLLLVYAYFLEERFMSQETTWFTINLHHHQLHWHFPLPRNKQTIKPAVVVADLRCCYEQCNVQAHSAENHNQLNLTYTSSIIWKLKSNWLIRKAAQVHSLLSQSPPAYQAEDRLTLTELLSSWFLFF